MLPQHVWLDVFPFCFALFDLQWNMYRSLGIPMQGSFRNRSAVSLNKWTISASQSRSHPLLTPSTLVTAIQTCMWLVLHRMPHMAFAEQSTNLGSFLPVLQSIPNLGNAELQYAEFTSKLEVMETTVR